MPSQQVAAINPQPAVYPPTRGLAEWLVLQAGSCGDLDYSLQYETACVPERLVFGSRLAKERSAEDHLFGDKDRFVTSAYKKKLQACPALCWLGQHCTRYQGHV